MDLEWNQCPSGKEDEVEKLPFEIFEIGAVKLDEDMNRLDSYSCYIKPQVYKELHYIAKGLTHVSMESLNAGKTFADAVGSLGGVRRMANTVYVHGEPRIWWSFSAI